MKITVEALVLSTPEAVWRAWTTPADIMRWNAASEDWHTTHAEVDLRVGGGQFLSRMEAKDGSESFDFTGTYNRLVPQKRIECTLGDRGWIVEFEKVPTGVLVREIFDADSTHSIEQQRNGWQAILESFVRYVESTD